MPSCSRVGDSANFRSDEATTADGPPWDRTAGSEQITFPGSRMECSTALCTDHSTWGGSSGFWGSPVGIELKEVVDEAF